eukprot:9181383-Pyramimonas_sp.AAC.1
MGGPPLQEIRAHLGPGRAAQAKLSMSFLCKSEMPPKTRQARKGRGGREVKSGARWRSMVSLLFLHRQICRYVK